MTEAIFKAQAKRLALHLSRVHGIKLKYASLLEAVADLHGRADWNTLVACGPAPEMLASADATFVELPLTPDVSALVAQSESNRPDEKAAFADLASLGISEQAAWQRAIMQSYGLCLVAASTGHGASTTLACSAAELVKAGRSVYTLDDDITDTDIAAKSSGRQAALSEVLVVGAIRSYAKLLAAFKAVERGQLVLASIHATNVDMAIRRMVRDLAVPPAQVSTCLKAVLAQRLVRTICTRCGGVDCKACARGYAGRTLVSECITARPQENILSLLGTGRTAPTFQDDAHLKFKAGVTDAQELTRVFGAEILEKPSAAKVV